MNQKPELQSLWSERAEKVMTLFKSIQKMYREQFFEKTKQFGFTGPQLGIIFGLHAKPFITLNEMSEHMGLSKSTVSGIVDRLVSQGVVKREIPEDNRRIVRLSLSQDFLNNNDLICLKNNYIFDIVKVASQEDMEIIIAGLDKLNTLMKENNLINKQNS